MIAQNLGAARTLWPDNLEKLQSDPAGAVMVVPVRPEPF